MAFEGETGDLADVVLTTLSLASSRYGVERVDLGDYYAYFDRLKGEFPNEMPIFHSVQMGQFLYSKALATALENALRLGLRIANPRFQYIEVTKELADRNISRLSKRAGTNFVERLDPIAKRLAAISREVK